MSEEGMGKVEPSRSDYCPTLVFHAVTVAEHLQSLVEEVTSKNPMFLFDPEPRVELEQ